MTTANSNLPRIVFVTNICPHYRVRTFEILASHLPTKFYFFSAGKEWYWQQQHGTRRGNFEFEYVPGFTIGHSRVTPSLAWKLWRGKYDVLIKCIAGKFALPLAYVIARLRRKPFVLWTGVWEDLNTPLHRLIAPLTYFVYRHADAVVTYGEHVKRYLVSKGVRSERIFPAHHAVDNDLYSRPVSDSEITQLRRQFEIAPDSRVVLYLGRLEDSKGLDYLLRAFAEVSDPNAVLLFVGEGSEKPSLQQLAEALGIAGRVRFAAYVKPEQTPPYYAMAWTAVLPSVITPRTREPWGLTVNEAMNQGTPVIASVSVGAAAGGLVRDGENGFVVPERDAAALALALRRVLNERGLRERLSDSARCLISRWDNERMVRGFRRAVDFVLHRGPNADAYTDELLSDQAAVEEISQSASSGQ